MAVNDLAGSGVNSALTPQLIYAGDKPIVTDAAVVVTTNITKYMVCARVATGITPFVFASHTAAQLVVAMQAALIGQQCPYASEGYFNHAALTWPAGTDLDTYAERAAYCTGGIKVGHITN